MGGYLTATEVLSVSKEKDNSHTIKELDGTETDKTEATESDSVQPDRGEELQQSLAAKTEEAQALQDKYLRLAAEFENYKRLAQREQREVLRFANENILKELLPVLDNLERAIECSKGSQERDALVQGVELTLKQFLETLTKFGVRPLASVGQAFDPSYHQAVSQVQSSSAPSNTVIEEYQKGYLLHDRVVRPAMVAVAIPPALGAADASDSGDAGIREAPEGPDGPPVDAAK